MESQDDPKNSREELKVDVSEKLEELKDKLEWLTGAVNIKDLTFNELIKMETRSSN